MPCGTTGNALVLEENPAFDRALCRTHALANATKEWRPVQATATRMLDTEVYKNPRRPFKASRAGY